MRTFLGNEDISEVVWVGFSWVGEELVPTKIGIHGCVSGNIDQINMPGR